VTYSLPGGRLIGGPGKNADMGWIRKVFQILINSQSFQLSLTPSMSEQGN
jgi:hypothetical protein